jgi:hypothetical protein
MVHKQISTIRLHLTLSQAHLARAKILIDLMRWNTVDWRWESEQGAAVLHEQKNSRPEQGTIGNRVRTETAAVPVDNGGDVNRG